MITPYWPCQENLFGSKLISGLQPVKQINTIPSRVSPYVEFFVENKNEEWWVMSKNEAIPGTTPAGQRFVRMAFPRILKVVHPTKAEAESEAAWLTNHVQEWEKCKAKAQRQRQAKRLAQLIS